MRCGEMLALRWGDVDLEQGILTIEKSRSIAKNRVGGEESNKYVLVEGNTATNLKHRMATIFRNAGLIDLSHGLHIFRRTFATRQYKKGVRTKEIAAYIGDLESTTENTILP